jgi:hypothetical protein
VLLLWLVGHCDSNFARTSKMTLQWVFANTTRRV